MAFLFVVGFLLFALFCFHLFFEKKDDSKSSLSEAAARSATSCLASGSE